jgi:hypothetical protein
MQDTRSVVRIVTSDCAGVVHIRDVGDYREPRHGPGMAVPPRLCELASRNSLAPVRWLEMMEVAFRYGHIVVVVLQLTFPVVVKQPVKQLLVIWPRDPVSI